MCELCVEVDSIPALANQRRAAISKKVTFDWLVHLMYLVGLFLLHDHERALVDASEHGIRMLDISAVFF